MPHAAAPAFPMNASDFQTVISAHCASGTEEPHRTIPSSSCQNLSVSSSPPQSKATNLMATNSGAFIIPSPLAARTTVVSHSLTCARGVAARAARRSRLNVTPRLCAAEKLTELKVGEIVAVQRRATTARPELYRVTGCSSSGDTVDVEPLEEYVRELYIPSSKPASYERASCVRAVPAEYVESQGGWIILDSDLQQAKSYFDSYYTIPATDGKAASQTERVAVKKEERKLTDDQIKRQVFTLSKQQALFAAVLALPVAAAFYAGFVKLRDVYQATEFNGELLGPNAFKTAALALTFGASVSSLVVGSGLFLYALNKKNDA